MARVKISELRDEIERKTRRWSEALKQRDEALRERDEAKERIRKATNKLNFAIKRHFGGWNTHEDPWTLEEMAGYFLGGANTK